MLVLPNAFYFWWFPASKSSHRLYEYDYFVNINDLFWFLIERLQEEGGLCHICVDHEQACIHHIYLENRCYKLITYFVLS